MALDRRSLKVRVSLALLVLTLFICAVAAVISVWVTRQETGEVLDGQLAQVARLIAALRVDDFAEYDYQLNKSTFSQSRYEPEIGFQVWNRDGRMLHSSMDLPVVERPDAAHLERHRRLLFQGREWRIVALFNPKTGHTVQVGAYRSLGWWFVAHVVMEFSKSVLLVAPLIFLVAALAVRKALRPIETLRREVSYRLPGVHDPIATRDVPTEVSGLAAEINAYSARYRELLNAVRRFSEDAAHELRTPVAAIRAHAQVALGEAQDDWLRDPLKQIESESAHIAKLLDQLLTLGRLDHTEADTLRKSLDLGDYIAELASGMGVEEISRSCDLLRIT